MKIHINHNRLNATAVVHVREFSPDIKAPNGI